MFLLINRSHFWLQTLLGFAICCTFLALLYNPAPRVDAFNYPVVVTHPTVIIPAPNYMPALAEIFKAAELAQPVQQAAISIPSSSPLQTASVPLQSREIDSVWNDIRQDFKIDHKAQQAQVKREIHKLLADQDKLNSILKAAGPYIYFIHQQTQLRGLPSELALIPVIESEFNPNDHSTKGATGLWQLMPGTAHELGIKVRSQYDGRRNVVVSTTAALAYFKDLGHAFNGNWYLAIAAYNCGQVKIDSAIRRAGSRSFWNLSVPKETKVYLPKLLAIAEIIKNPAKYGVTLPPIANQPYFSQIKMTKPVSLTHVAKTSGVPLSTLKVLNPDYNHEILPTKKGYILLVPVGTATIRAKQDLNISSVTT